MYSNIKYVLIYYIQIYSIIIQFETLNFFIATATHSALNFIFEEKYIVFQPYLIFKEFAIIFIMQHVTVFK